MKVLITGAAGLVGQNLCQRLKQSSEVLIHAVDKDSHNLAVLKKLNPEIQADVLDLAEEESYACLDADYDCVIINHAQISAKKYDEFERNNILATEYLINYLQSHSCPNIIHISSSVVNSEADDFYSSTKTKQEQLVMAAFPNVIVLRPTLMFGPLDRKHLGWLARFMMSSPIFPIPGDGKYIRQPLYVGDFVEVIARSIEGKVPCGTYNISGVEYIYYIDIINKIKKVTGSKCMVFKINFLLFKYLLKFYAIFSKNPPFTADQLNALVIPEVFEISDWPNQTGVTPTEFERALHLTFQRSVFKNVKLKF